MDNKAPLLYPQDSFAVYQHKSDTAIHEAEIAELKAKLNKVIDMGVESTSEAAQAEMRAEKAEAEVIRLNKSFSAWMDSANDVLAEREQERRHWRDKYDALAAESVKVVRELAEVKRRVLEVADDDDLGNTALAALARQIREGK